MASTTSAQIANKELRSILSYEEDMQRYLFHVFTWVALSFLLVYAVLQFRTGLIWLSLLYGFAALVVTLNLWAIQFHNRLTIAANVFAGLGPMVLLPWQVSGGIAETGLMWFPVYAIFVMFFVPGKGGSFWVIFIYLASFLLLLAQLQGILPFPFRPEMMFHFYFVGGITYTLTFLFLQAERIIFDVLKRQVQVLQASDETSMVGNWTWDIKRNLVNWSEPLYTILGLDRHKKVSYESYLALVHPEDKPLIEETVREALRDHQPFSLVHRVKHSDGSVVWMHSLGEVMLDAKGNPTKLFGTVQNITDRLAAGGAPPGDGRL